MEVRLSNQQRHTITAILLSAVLVIFGLAMLGIRQASETDPVENFVEASDSSTSSSLESNTTTRRAQARSNAGFQLSPDWTQTSTTTVRVARRAPTEPPPTAAPVTDSTTTSEVVDSSTTTTTAPTSTTDPVVDPPTQPTTTEDTQPDVSQPDVTRRCRGNGKKKCDGDD